MSGQERASRTSVAVSATTGAPEVAHSGLARLVEIARQRRRIVAFTGAGISTESGIPDYRGPESVWRRQTPLTAQAFLHDPDARRGYWERRRTGYTVMADAGPNAGHLALADLERARLLHAIITQNIDGLHQKAGNDPARVIELHGTTHQIVCTECGARYSGADVQRWLATNDDIPECPNCGGLLRPATILFGEALAAPVWARAVTTTHEADLLLVVGTARLARSALPPDRGRHRPAPTPQGLPGRPDRGRCPGCRRAS